MNVRVLAARGLRPPVADMRFWIIQLLAVSAGAVYWATISGGGTSVPWLPPHAALALFLIPVMYAALNFGLSGSLATAGWVVLLGAVSLARDHAVGDVVAVGIQATTLLCIAIFVGQRVEREVRARRDAETASAALRRSEARLRDLFETSPAPTLLIGAGGEVRAMNPAAAALFAGSRRAPADRRLDELVGADAATAIASGRETVQELVLPGGRRHFLRPVISRVPGETGGVQVVLLDVSEERRRMGVKDAYAAHVLKAQEEERARIAQELHDEPLQQVMQLSRELDPSAGPGTAQTESARRLADQIADDLRRMARGLRPPALEDLGLVAGLRMLARDTTARSTTAITLAVEGERRRLDEPVELGLFRIAQEGLRNIERHAQATTAHVSLAFGPREVVLTIADDGIGLPSAVNGEVPAEHAQGRLGLIGMQERASLLGGTLRVRSQPGRGTLLRATVPA